MQLDYSAFCDQGDRNYNEDSIGISEVLSPTACFVLADGLGSHGMGDVASQAAVDEALKTMVGHTDNCTNLIRSAFTNAQKRILFEQQSHDAKSKMKTTMVLLFIDDQKAYFGHIGDSRLYHFHRGKTKKLTSDHSVPQMLVTAGEIKEADIRFHPDRNRLLRALGADDEEVPRCAVCDSPVQLKKGDGLLLCSDGFWEYITEAEMHRIYSKAESPLQWIEQMVEIVKQNGKGKNMDNFSAIAVAVGWKGARKWLL